MSLIKEDGVKTMNFKEILEEEVDKEYAWFENGVYDGSTTAIYNAMKRVYNQALEDAVNSVTIDYDDSQCRECGYGGINEESILKLKK